MAEESLRESLEKAYATDGEPPAGTEQPGAGGEPPEGSSQEAPQTGQGEGTQGTPAGEAGTSGYLADTAGAKQRVEGQGAPGTQPAAGQPKAPDQQGAQGAADGGGLKAPQSWRPEIREHWGKLPVDVQQEIVRRETQVNRALTEAAQYVQHYNQFNEVCAPYASLIAMDGGNPLNTFSEYLKTAAMLRMGAPNEKADAIANAVMQFGIDVRHLDTALASRMNGKQPQQQQQQQFRDPRLDNLLNQMQQRQQSYDMELQRTQQAEIDAFATDSKNEFFEDLRNDVANILELYANQGVRCTLKEAYDKACIMHPTISKIVAARNQAEAAKGLVRQSQQNIDAKRRAALGPPGSPNIGPGGENNNMSLRDTISAAMQHVESRV